MVDPKKVASQWLSANNSDPIIRDLDHIVAPVSLSLSTVRNVMRALRQTRDPILLSEDWSDVVKLEGALDGAEFYLGETIKSLNTSRTASQKAAFQKPFRLTEKELARADRSTDVPFTIVARQQPDGRYLVAAVALDTGLILAHGFAQMTVDGKDEISNAVRVVKRMLDKFFGSSAKMTDRSRHEHRSAAGGTLQADLQQAKDLATQIGAALEILMTTDLVYQTDFRELRALGSRLLDKLADARMIARRNQFHDDV